MPRRDLRRLRLPAILAAGFLIVLALPGRSGPLPAALDLQELSGAIEGLAAHVADATVTLHVTVSDEQGEVMSGEGSGFVLDAFAGTVITNAHVVKNAKTVRVIFYDRREALGKVEGVDSLADLAVVRIPAGAARRQLAWGDSDRLRPGSLVMAVGSPLQLNGTTSLGVVSALHRKLNPASDNYEDYVQFDAFIDRGSSGGPLVDMSGEVIGINTAIGASGGSTSWIGISYAVPSAIASRFCADLAEYGRVRRGWAGILVDRVTADLAKSLQLERPYGAVLRTVVAGGPGEAAGLKPNDVLLTLDGVEIADSAHVRARVAARAPGSRVEFRVLRGREILTIPVVVGELAEQEPD